MEIAKRAKEELEHRVSDIEAFINRRGLGSGYLNKAKRAQRNINIALLAVGVITVAGITIWALRSGEDE
ncbi:hypothetical protein JKA74_07775 [Marivirga sp. S37H4]|uniref:Uncharacterized protein n=1 Tax=Marivirga aurantiaca TaxID=2802615 RepID=A0A934WY27_9BACT|nr:hypothetical protein [Marivirga aurantiaca]MBK6264931.1 hypothetical protein [Marivirga aurantiaca]